MGPIKGLGATIAPLCTHHCSSAGIGFAGRDNPSSLGPLASWYSIGNGDEDVTISPIYTIRLSDGSEQRHGDGFGSTLDVQVPASKTIEWWGDAGQPEGIKTGAPIGSCVPEVMDVTR